MSSKQTMTNNTNTLFGSDAKHTTNTLFGSDAKHTTNTLFGSDAKHTTNNKTIYYASKLYTLPKMHNKYANVILNKHESLLYYNDETFRAMILEKIFNPQKQLYLDLSNCNQITDVTVLQNVCSLDLRYCDNITDVSVLSNVYYLNLKGCYNITDVSALKYVQNLFLP
jgi:hypothetical protein